MDFNLKITYIYKKKKKKIFELGSKTILFWEMDDWRKGGVRNNWHVSIEYFGWVGLFS